MRANQPRNNMLTNVTLFTCIMITLAAIYFQEDEEMRRPEILAAIPSTLDLRVLPSFKKCDFSVKEEVRNVEIQGVCIGASWALSIAQTFSNILSLKWNTTVTMSAQELLECSSFDNKEVCHYIDDERLQEALMYIQTTGLTQQSCYPFTPLLTPNNCSRVCPSTKEQIVREKAIVREVQKDVNSITNQIGNKGPILAIIQYRDSLNYYTSGILQNTGENYGLLMMQVIGWKDQGKTLIAKGNFGINWGMNGIVHVSLNDPTLKGLYSIEHAIKQEL